MDSFLHFWPSFELTREQLQEAHARLKQFGYDIDYSFLANVRLDVSLASDLWDYGQPLHVVDSSQWPSPKGHVAGPPGGGWHETSRFFKLPNMEGAWVVVCLWGDDPTIDAHPGLGTEEWALLLGPMHGVSAAKLVDPEFTMNPPSETDDAFDEWVAELGT